MSKSDDPDPEEPTIETRADALAEMRDLRGRSVVLADFAQELADPFGVDLSESDIIAPTNEHLPYHEDDAPAVNIAELAAHLVAELGGDPQTSSMYIGRGTDADARGEANFDKLETFIEDDE